ncbi:MAG: BatA domain-containing protein [Flavobacteriaceae bacterium]|nr:BatA domain-containing protein [Flavobacteriaceae bacterium]
MQFKHPEILFALFLLIVPVIIHLFQLRRFKKVPFTNVKFLKQVELQTRKSSRLKKFLILCSRLLLFASLIMAFAQPYLSNVKDNTPVHNYIYLDNSYSMQAKGKDGDLLKRAAQDILEKNTQTDHISIITNNENFENLSYKDLKNNILSIEYHPTKLNLTSVLLKIKNSINDDKTTNNIILISDFQSNNINEKFDIDSLNQYYFTQLKPLQANNVSIDSVYLATQNNESLGLKVIMKNYGEEKKDLSISLFDDQILSGKSTISIEENSFIEVDFSIPNKNAFKGTFKIDDGYLTFDNELFFVIKKPEIINITVVGKDNSFLSKIYTKDEFNFTGTTLTNFDYNSLEEQQLILLNELETIPNTFINSLKSFVEKGGNLVIIPSMNSKQDLYNNLLRELKVGRINGMFNSPLSITKINFSHPLLRGVFEKEIKNFQYPTVRSKYNSNLSGSSSILDFENGTSFVSESNSQNGKIYWFSASLNTENSNFKSSPLIVPIFYNFGLFSHKSTELYYTVGRNNNIEIDTKVKKDEVLHLKNEKEDYIPLQQIFNKKVIINTMSNPSTSGFYDIRKNDQRIDVLAYNYDRIESELTYANLDQFVPQALNVRLSDSIDQVFNAISDNNKVTQLWQVFLALSLLFLLIEIFLLKYLKS